jgi:hypothetical protein
MWVSLLPTTVAFSGAALWADPSLHLLIASIMIIFLLMMVPAVLWSRTRRPADLEEH